MPYVETTIEVKGEPKAAYDIAKVMEDYPKFMENVESVRVIERVGNTTITEWVTKVDNRTFKWQEKDIFDEDNNKITYRQTVGDLKKFEGEWRFEEIPGGTRITLTVDFDLGIPMISGLLNPILTKKTKSNCEAMLKAIKEQVEKAG